MNTEELEKKIVQWHRDRNLINGSTDKDQLAKLIQEMGELSDNICKGKYLADDIGDMIVVLINIAERNGLTLAECMASAWDDIKDRRGRMVDGVFVKEADLSSDSVLKESIYDEDGRFTRWSGGLGNLPPNCS